MKTVSISFVGAASDDVAQAFYTWIIDGGLQDQIVDGLTEQTDDNIEVDSIIDFNNETLSLTFKSNFKTA